MRGRLIFPFLAEIYRLDTYATATETPPGYDPDFKESIRIDDGDDGPGEPIRREYPPVRIPCQVEPQAFDQLRMFASGNAPKSEIDLVFHFKDLEKMGLVDVDNGDALIRPGSRLSGIYDVTGALVQAIRRPPGLYVLEAKPIGFGLNRKRPKRNLLWVSFSDRQQASRRMG